MHHGEKVKVVEKGFDYVVRYMGFTEEGGYNQWNTSYNPDLEGDSSLADRLGSIASNFDRSLSRYQFTHFSLWRSLSIRVEFDHDVVETEFQTGDLVAARPATVIGGNYRTVPTSDFVVANIDMLKESNGQEGYISRIVFERGHRNRYIEESLDRASRSNYGDWFSPLIYRQ